MKNIEIKFKKDIQKIDIEINRRGDNFISKFFNQGKINLLNKNKLEINELLLDVKKLLKTQKNNFEKNLKFYDDLNSIPRCISCGGTHFQEIDTPKHSCGGNMNIKYSGNKFNYVFYGEKYRTIFEYDEYGNIKKTPPKINKF